MQITYIQKKQEIKYYLVYILFTKKKLKEILNMAVNPMQYKYNFLECHTQKV